eukprot:5243597-Pyramimonas_sp.AAC.2
MPRWLLQNGDVVEAPVDSRRRSARHAGRRKKPELTIETGRKMTSTRAGMLLFRMAHACWSGIGAQRQSASRE